MKCFLYLLIALLVNTASSFAQEAPIKETSLWEIATYKNLSYPTEGRASGISDYFVVELKLDQKGQIDSIAIVQQARNYFMKESLDALEASRDFWDKEFWGEKEGRSRFLIAFDYDFQGTSPTTIPMLAQKQMSKKKYDKALKILNKGIAEDPYKAELYDLRSKVHLLLGQEKEYLEDASKATQIQNDLLFTFKMRAFVVKSTRQVTGSF